MDTGNIDQNTIKLIPPVRMPALVIGEGSIRIIGDEAKKLGVKNALIVTDKEMIKFGLTKDAEESLKQNNIDIKYFDEVTAEPTIGIIEKAISKAREEVIDIVIGIGGGSVMDATKVVACVAKNDITVYEYMEKKDYIGEHLPFILAPTTSATGAEVNSGAVVIHEKGNSKKSINKEFSEIKESSKRIDKF